MAKEVKKTEEGEVIINTKTRVTVYATDKSRFHKAGKPIVCAEKVAERLVKNGKATYEKGKPEKAIKE